MKSIIKKLLLVVLFLFTLTLVVGCDFIGGEKSDEEVVVNVLNNIKINYAEGETSLTISKDIQLPSSSVDGCSITWKSNDEAVISKDGKVTQADVNKEVKLTVVVTLNETSLEKSFNVTVLAKGNTEPIIDPVEGLTTFAEILNLQVESGSQTEKTYKVQGKITEVQNTTFGNVLITDGTTSLLVYGIFDAEGNRYDALSDKPTVGDTIVVEGPVKNFNGTYEILNSTLIKLTKGTTPITPVVDDELSTVAQVLALSIEDKAQTEKEYKLKGKITEVQNTTYGNVIIKDETGSILVYGLYDSTGSTRYDALSYKPVVGDTITVTGPIKNFNGTYEIANAKLLNVEKQSDEPEPPLGDDEIKATIAEALAVKLGESMNTEKKYVVTGTIKEIKNATFGNVLITDGTNDILVYRMYDATGKRYDAFDYKPVVGDTITVSGVIMNAGGVNEVYEAKLVKCVQGTTPVVPPVTQDVIDITIADLLKLSIAEDATTNEMYRVSGKVTLVQNETRGDVYITDGTNSLLIYGVVNSSGATYADLTNKPTAGDTITVSGVVKNYKGTYEIINGLLENLVEGEPEELKTSTIAEALKLNKGTLAKVEGVVIAIDTKEFLIKDATGTMLVYMNYTAFDYVPGDKLTITGALAEYSGAIQFDNKAEIVKTGHEDYKDPEVFELDRDKLADQFENPTVGLFVEIEGKLTIDGSYYDLIVDGSDIVVGLRYPLASISLGLYVNSNIIVRGYIISANTEDKLVNMIPVGLECLEEISGVKLPVSYDFILEAKEKTDLAPGWSWTQTSKGSYASPFYQSFRTNKDGIKSPLLETANKLKVTFTYYLNNYAKDKASYIKVTAYKLDGTMVDVKTSKNLNIVEDANQNAKNADKIYDLVFELEGEDIAYITIEFIKDGGGNIGFSTVKIEKEN